MDHCLPHTVLVQLGDVGDLDPARRRAGEVALRPGRAAIGNPEVHLDTVPREDAQSFATVAQFSEAERALVERDCPALVGHGQRWSGCKEPDCGTR